MKFRELGAEVVTSVKEGWDILRGKRDTIHVQPPPDRPDVQKVANPDTRRDAGTDRE